jgi:hypothetical protein
MRTDIEKASFRNQNRPLKRYRSIKGRATRSPPIAALSYSVRSKERNYMFKLASLSSHRATLGVALATTTLALSLGIAGCKSTPPPPDDAATATALQSRISSDEALKTEAIQSSVQNGIATLNGTVSNDAARALAASDAAQVPGIRTVVNNLSVQAPVAAAPAPVVTTPPPAPVAPIRTPARAAIEKKKPAAAVKEPEMAHNQPPPPHVPIERSAPQQQTPPPAPSAPAFKNVTIPAGTTLPVRITQTLDSATTQQGENFNGTVATDIIIDGLVAIPQGTAVTGRVTEVHEAAHFKGSSLLTIELTNINHNGEHTAIATEPFSKEGTGRGKNTAAKVGGGAAVGAILGGIFGGGKGAAIGAASGAGVGAGAQAITKGQQVQIPSETLIRFSLTNAVQVRASTSNAPSTDTNGQRRPLNTPQ